MNRRNHRAIALAGGLLFVVAAGTLLLRAAPTYIRSSERPPDAVISSGDQPTTRPSSAETPPPAPEPGELSVLFGFKSSPTTPRAAPSKPAGASPSRAGPPRHRPAPIRYVGWTSRDGNRIYLFVDSDTGRVFGLAVGRADTPWRIVRMENEAFVLSDGSADYRVARR